MPIRLDTDPRLCVTDADCAAIERGDAQTPTDIALAAAAATRHRWLIDIGPHTLEVETDTVPDFDSAFTARCLDTGEHLRINGWLIDNVEPLDA